MKKIKICISLVCVIAILFSSLITNIAADGGKTVTATTSATIKQGGSGTCYVYIDSTESLAALDVTVHFDPAKVKINSVYNSVSCTMYDSVKNTDNVQFSYILDGKGSTSKTTLFYFYYSVLSNAEVGNAYFDITVGEAYDNGLNDIAVSGSRTNFTITETVTNKTCSVSSTSSIKTSVGQEFSLSYRFSTYQIASGSSAINYDPELFEVAEVTSGGFLDNKISDINTKLLGSVYISFVGTEYNTKYDFVTIKFKTIKNVNEASKITFKATELCDKDLNPITCSDYVTTANVTFDETYVGDAPKMSVTAKYNAITKKVTANILLEENSKLGAGDFVLEFDPNVLTFSSYEKGFSPDFFNINDKEVAEGKLKFSIISLNDINTKETVLTIVFNVLQTKNEQPTAITIKGNLIADSLTNPIMLQFINANIIIPEQHTLGDINDDENVNLKDLVTIAQYVAGWENLEVNEHAIDVNGDGKVDLQDVNHLARYLAGWDVELY